MSKIKALHDLVDLLADHDERYQQTALDDLLHSVNAAEQAVADSHLRVEERWQERIKRSLANFERRAGKVEAMKLRAKLQELIDPEDDIEL